jgi:putative ABC transport system substrate-binding protein
LALPLAALAQQPTNVSRIGYLRRTSREPADTEALRLGLRELGYVEGQNLIDARGVSELPQAFAAIESSQADAIFMADDVVLAGSGEIRKQVIKWALGRRLPIASSHSSVASDGGLVSLGTDHLALGRRAAFYVDKILKGAKPSDLPVERPTIYKLSVNLKTAKALGLTIPQSLLLRVDEVIQ